MFTGRAISPNLCIMTFGTPCIFSACQPKVKILPWLEPSQIQEHWKEFRETTLANLDIKDMSSIPVQVSLDATAVTGRVNSRGSQDSSETRRILYGLSTDMPTTQTWVRYFPQPGEPSLRRIQTVSPSILSKHSQSW